MHRIIEEVAAVLTVAALSFAATVGHSGVMFGLGLLLLAGGVVGFWRNRAIGWMLTTSLGGATALLIGVAWVFT